LSPLCYRDFFRLQDKKHQSELFNLSSPPCLQFQDLQQGSVPIAVLPPSLPPLFLHSSCFLHFSKIAVPHHRCASGCFVAFTSPSDFTIKLLLAFHKMAMSHHRCANGCLAALTCPSVFTFKLLLCTSEKGRFAP